MRAFALGFALAFLLGASWGDRHRAPYPERTYYMSIDMRPNAYGPRTLGYWAGYLDAMYQQGATVVTFCVGHARGYEATGSVKELQPRDPGGFSGSLSDDGWFPFITYAEQHMPKRSR